MAGDQLTFRGARLAVAASVAIVAALAAVVARPAPADAARGIELGLVDKVFDDPALAGSRAAWLSRAEQARAGLILLRVRWRSIAPNSPPPGFNARNPADPAYKWDDFDAIVRDAVSRGFRVGVLVTAAPAFAEGPNRPPISEKTPAGTWMPDPGAFGDFAYAIATRYSGRFAGLPGVHIWQGWAEPNLGINLAPQFQGRTAVSPEHYRAMLNAFYAGVKAADPSNFVLTSGTAPYGNLFPTSGPQLERMQPLRFWRGVFCYKEGKKRKKGKKKKGRRASAAAKLIGTSCPNPVHLDAISHHPINVGRPGRHARNPDDVSTPDLGKIKRILRAAERSGRVIPGGRHPFWATEIYWESKPPTPHGVPLGRQARWLSESFYLMWKQGVQTVIWFEIVDLPELPGLAVPQSGLFLADGTAKPAFDAFRFPFFADRLKGGGVRVWGLAPAPGKVTIERRGKAIKSLGASGNRVFVGRVRGGGKLRASQGAEHSLAVAPK